jgi:hypothetical protein
MMDLEAMDLENGKSSERVNRKCRIIYLDDLGIQFQPLLLVGEEFLHIFALISLKLDYLSHLAVIHDGAIAGYRTAVSLRQVLQFST